MAAHQCARFYEDSKALHEIGVRHLGKYLIGTKDREILFKPNKDKGLECFIDDGFVGGWQRADVRNPENFLSRIVYVTFYADCIIVYISKLKTEIALSTSES